MPEPRSTRAKIMKRTVDAEPIPSRGESRLWDTELKGFCLRVYPKGRKSPQGRKVYSVKFRVGRTQRWFSIGEHGDNPWNPTTARAKAEEVIRDASAGKDQQAAKLERRKDSTVSELIDAYLAEGPEAKPSKRASSWARDKSSLESHVRKLLGKKIARDLRPADVTKMAKEIAEGVTAADMKTEKKRGRAIVKGGSGTAVRTVATVSAMFAWAMQHGGLPVSANPAAGAGRTLGRRAAKERFLTTKEAGKLFDTLTAMVAETDLLPSHADAFRLLMLTGARKTEIVGLRWSEVDLARNRLVLAPERSKAGEKTGERRIAINSAAREILVRRRTAADARELKDKQERRNVPPTPFVFPAYRGEGHVVGLQKAWERVRPKAGLADVRIHDLRHSYASFAIADGASLFMVARALGHADTRVTERYSHLAGDALDQLAEAAAKRMGAPTSEDGNG